MYIIIGVLALIVTVFTIFIYAYPFPESVYSAENIHNLESARKNAFTMIGCIAGLMVIYPIEKKFIRFETNAVWWAQILKVVLGLAVVLLVKEGLKTPLEAIFNGSLIARSVRYFLVVIVAGIVWPLTFKWFSKLGKNKSK